MTQPDIGRIIAKYFLRSTETAHFRFCLIGGVWFRLEGIILGIVLVSRIADREIGRLVVALLRAVSKDMFSRAAVPRLPVAVGDQGTWIFFGRDFSCLRTVLSSLSGEERCLVPSAATTPSGQPLLPFWLT